jgi:hypothetical protein
MRSVVGPLKAQVSAARYAFHKVTLKRYGDAVTVGMVIVNPDGVEMIVKMPPEQAKMMYDLAMENYDGIISNAVSGASAEANQESMDEGFVI